MCLTRARTYSATEEYCNEDIDMILFPFHVILHY